MLLRCVAICFGVFASINFAKNLFLNAVKPVVTCWMLSKSTVHLQLSEPWLSEPRLSKQLIDIPHMCFESRKKSLQS